jgi:WD40 repeat protein
MLTQRSATLSVLGLTLGASFIIAPPGFRLTGMLRPDGGLVADEPAPQQAVNKEAVAPPDSHAWGLAISPNSKTLAATCIDSTVRLIDVRTGERRVIRAGLKRGYVGRVSFTPDGKTIVGVGTDDRLRLWDVASTREMRSISALGDKENRGVLPLSPNSLAISPNGALIAVGGNGTADGSGIFRMDDNSVYQIRVLNANTYAEVWSKSGRRGYNHQLVFSPDSQTVAADTSREVMLLDARTGEQKQTLKPQVGRIWALAFSPDGKFLASCGNGMVEGKTSRWLTLWDLRSRKVLHSMEAGDTGRVSVPGTLAFSPDGKSLVSAGSGLGVILNHNGVVRGQKMINDVKLWDIATGNLKWTSANGHGHITSLVFSPDGEALFCCDDSATYRIDARTGQDRLVLMESNEGQPR